MTLWVAICWNELPTKFALPLSFAFLCLVTFILSGSSRINTAITSGRNHSRKRTVLLTRKDLEKTSDEWVVANTYTFAYKGALEELPCADARRAL
eukprot:1361735-Amphidinium_carterae.1